MLTVYTLPSCPQCEQTKTMLAAGEVSYTEVDLSASGAALEAVKEMGYRTAPVVVAEDGESWGGFRRDLLEDAVAKYGTEEDIYL